MDGRIHSFQSLGTVDGPGVRSVVFLQGCSLRCPYCHNPDTWDMHGGSTQSAQSLFQKIQKYTAYYGETGGITVSGGEPLLQADFVYELFSLCRAHGISTALDTSGVLLNDSVRRLFTVTDIVLLDIKYATDAKYQRYIGVELQTVLRFLAYANEQKKRVIVRQVITPGVNDTKADMAALREIVRQYPCIEKVELLPFMKLCAEKYTALGIPFPFDRYPQATVEQIRALEQELKA